MGEDCIETSVLEWQFENVRRLEADVGYSSPRSGLFRNLDAGRVVVYPNHLPGSQHVG